MKPPLFHVGQAVVCIDGGGWRTAEEGGRPGYPGPKTGDLCTVSRLVPLGPFWYLGLVEFPGDEYNECAFAPAEEMPAEMLAELLEALEPVTA